MPVITDFIFGPGTSVGTVAGAFVRFTNQVTGAQFVSAVATNPQGQYTMPNLPPGLYTVATGPTAAGPFTLYDPNYLVGDAPGDHILTSGTAPTISAVNAGISGVPTVVGNDQAGLITFSTTAAPPGAGANLFTVNFVAAYTFVPAILMIFNANANAAAFGGGGLTTAFSVFVSVALPASTAGIVVAYFVIQPRVV